MNNRFTKDEIKMAKTEKDAQLHYFQNTNRNNKKELALNHNIGIR